MAIQGIDAFKQALLAQQYGAAIGGTRPFTPERVSGVTGKEIESSPKFDWKNLNRFDGALTGSTPQTSIGKTSEVPAENIFAVGRESGAQRTTEFGSVPKKSSETLISSLNAIDAKDIGLNSNKNGFEGQMYINYLA